MTAALLGFAILLALVFFGMPIGFAMTAVGFAGIAWFIGFSPALHMAGQIVYDNSLNYGFAVLPLFLLMGSFIARSGLSEELFDAANSFLGHLRGGLAMAAVVACGGFSAVCGSSTATAATMTKFALPVMRRHNYSDALATGSLAAGGTLGILIPPSIALVLYGFITGTDIAKLFIAGLLPGILAVFLLCLAISLAVLWRPALAPHAERSDWSVRFRSLKKVWGIALLFFLIIGSLYFGICTPTEAAGLGATIALIFALARRSLSRNDFYNAVAEAVLTTTLMFIVLFGGLVFANFIEITGLPHEIGGWIERLGTGPILTALVIGLIYLILGCVLDMISTMLLTVPIFFPIMMAQGFDPVWFGVFVVIAAEIGLMTPPFGLNIFVIRSLVPDVSTATIYRGSAPFVAAETVLLVLVILFPAIVTVLPDMM